MILNERKEYGNRLRKLDNAREELKEKFEKFMDGEFVQFDRVENKLHRRQDICAFLILSELAPSDKFDIVIGAEHDVIYLSVNLVELAQNATEDHIRDLVRCGVMFDEDTDCLSMFV